MLLLFSSRFREPVGESRVLDTGSSKLIRLVNPPLPQSRYSRSPPHLGVAETIAINAPKCMPLTPVQSLIQSVRQLGVVDYGTIVRNRPDYRLVHVDQLRLGEAEVAEV